MSLQPGEDQAAQNAPSFQPASTPVKQTRPPIEPIRAKLVLSEIECASAFMPVLAIEQDTDLATSTAVAMKAHVIKRTDLAARLNVDPRRPIGVQLAERGQISRSQARQIDGGLFQGRKMEVRLRIDDAVENVDAALSELLSKGLIESLTEQMEVNGYLFVQLKTNNLVELAEALSELLPDLVVLVAINGLVLYL